MPANELSDLTERIVSLVQRCRDDGLANLMMLLDADERGDGGCLVLRARCTKPASKRGYVETAFATETFGELLNPQRVRGRMSDPGESIPGQRRS